MTRTNDASHPDQKDLIDFIEENSDNLRIGLTIRLGQGHTTRFQGKPKYNGLNYYANNVEDTRQLLGAA